VRTVLTRTAERFVSREALTAIGGSVALADAWPEEPGTGALHVELARWPDAVAVHPASMHFLARFAVGLADSPVLLALQCTAAPVAVAPALPPGALEHSAALVEHLATLDRRGVLIAAPHPGRSASTGGNDAAVAAPLPALLGLLERRRAATAVP
jgi:phosphopantothenoylcysteine synthetase/decarboxylase